MRASCCWIGLCAPAGAIVLPTTPRVGVSRSVPVVAALPSDGEDLGVRYVRVSVGNAELLARAATKETVKTVGKSDGININIAGVQIWPNPTPSVIGLTVVMAMFLRKVFIKGGFMEAIAEGPDKRFLTSSKAEEAELHEFQCEKCGFTIFPARGREGKFFPDDYKCQMCNAPKEAFFDMNSLDDPRAIAARANDKDFTYETEEIEVNVAENDDEDFSTTMNGKQNLSRLVLDVAQTFHLRQVHALRAHNRPQSSGKGVPFSRSRSRHAVFPSHLC
eukprot:scaffold174157_cov29-Tisochrysis_lutea.AAC.5